MSELRVDGSQLRDVSSRILGAVSSVRFNGALSAPAEAVLGASEVASALREGTREQDVRSGVVADALQSVGSSPADAAAAFEDADAALARAF